MVSEQGYSCTDAARSLGIATDLVSRWKREQSNQQGKSFPGHGKLTQEQQDIRDLEKQVKRLQMEKDI